MPEISMRLLVLILFSLLTFLMTRAGGRFLETRGKRVLAAEPPLALLTEESTSRDASPARVRILAFVSAHCPQCHRLQTPALQRLLAARGPAVAVVEVDASASPELTHRYQVLTVPTTVVLDATGRAHAVNYGFAPTQRLLEQVDAVLALSSDECENCQGNHTER
jgi:thioredoxin-like negative regulator of GroEL